MRLKRPTLLRHKAALLLVAAAVTVIALVAAIAILERQVQDVSTQGDTARQVQQNLNDLELGMVNQEAGLTGYALAKDPQFLQPYDLGRDLARTANQALNQTPSDPHLHGQVTTAMHAAAAWQEWAQSRRQLIASGAILSPADIAEGERLFGAFRAADAAADRTLVERATRADAETEGRTNFLQYATPTAGAVILLLLLLLVTLVFRSILLPIGELAAAARNIMRSESTEIPARGRNDELGELAEALATLQQDAQRRLELSQAMVEVNGYVRREDFAGPGLARAAEVLDADQAAIVLVREDGYHVTMLRLGSVVLPVPTESDRDPALEALRTSEPVIGDYDDQTWDSRARKWASSLGVHAVLSLPLVSRGITVGAIAVMRSRGRPGFTEVDVQVARLIAGPMAAAVQLSSIFEEKEEQSKALQILNDTGAVATSGVLDPEALSRLIAEKAGELVGGYYATLCLFHPGDGLLHIVADTHPRPWSHAFEPGNGALGVAFRTRNPVVVEDYARWQNAQDWALARDMKSVLAVPLLANDRAVGALAVHSDVKHKFTHDDVRLLTLLTAQVGPVLEAARVYSRMAGRST